MSKFEKLHKTTPRTLKGIKIIALPRTLIEDAIFFHLDYATDLVIPCFKRTDFTSSTNTHIVCEMT